jgi:hypothetical protein
MVKAREVGVKGTQSHRILVSEFDDDLFKSVI